MKQIFLDKKAKLGLKSLRWWSLLYSLFFLFLSITHINNELIDSNKYNWMVVIIDIAIYLLMNIGNIIYALSMPYKTIQGIWKILAPLFVIYFIAGVLINGAYDINLDSENILLSNFIAWGIALFVFFPTFRANFKLSKRGGSE